MTQHPPLAPDTVPSSSQGLNSDKFFVPSPNLRRWALASLALLLLSLGYCWWMASLPNQTLEFTRETRSNLDMGLLSRKLEEVPEWKTWFQSVKEARIVDSQDHPLPDSEQKARTGALVKLHVDANKGPRHRFDLIGRITRYVPGQVLEIQVLDDSSGKIFRLFDQLSWKIELAPEASSGGVKIFGLETAHTSHWRSRLFAKIGKRIMLHQIFYPDLQTLADPHKPDPMGGSGE